MGNAHVVLIVPLGELGGAEIGNQLPGGGHPWLPGHGGGGARPDHSLPGGGHISNRPPNVPPNVVWPPSNPARPDNSLPGWSGGGAGGGGGATKPIQPPTAGTKPVDPGAALPAGASLVLVYNAEKGWQGAVVDHSGATKPVAPPETAPAPTS